jgi:anti-sigma regulatory factor (Ser/Thr protein kinase)
VADAVTRRMQLHSSASATLHTLRCDLLLQGVQAGDDVTLLVIRRPPDDMGHARIELPVSLRVMRQVRDFTAEQATLAGLDEEDSSLLATACTEAFTNVVRHAIGLLDELIAKRGADRLVLELVHLGDPFTPPVDPPETDFGLYPEGGFGLIIMRGATDALEYLHESGVNTVRMTRMLGQADRHPKGPGGDDDPLDFMLLPHPL